ncbi:hypothetical protein H6F86_14830 [Phormidium sp. FACHB-592]|uniref:Uncharacterized protein n=1 Tax=Stenomitos frigidus AS-A4 TaxID=2933935 RepID=A0ABV0KUA3_9CYAN|nr:hypothetical protein [Phormidium sp. FACHB-592]MBD2075146.1 hypothetical protein [Phormidium sp. FACHB-592]
MSVDYWLFRVPFKRDDPKAELTPFGSQEEVVNRLCSQPGFTLHRKKRIENDEPWAVIVYITANEEGEESDVEFSVQGDPVTCISIHRAFREDFLPIITVLSELAPFEIVDINGEAISPDELF